MPRLRVAVAFDAPAASPPPLPAVRPPACMACDKARDPELFGWLGHSPSAGPAPLAIAGVKAAGKETKRSRVMADTDLREADELSLVKCGEGVRERCRPGTVNRCGDRW